RICRARLLPRRPLARREGNDGSGGRECARTRLSPFFSVHPLDCITTTRRWRRARPHHPLPPAPTTPPHAAATRARPYPCATSHPALSLSLSLSLSVMPAETVARLPPPDTITYLPCRTDQACMAPRRSSRSLRNCQRPGPKPGGQGEWKGR